MAKRSSSPWNFTSSAQMKNWDVVLCVGETKFYVHKSILSLFSDNFGRMFEGDFREKWQQEVAVNVEAIGEGISADHYEAFLQCFYPDGSEPTGITVGAGTPAAILACNKAFGVCSAKCALIALAPYLANFG
ncbi:hypothetical protein AAVH_20476 [Aphelenchoides avenae]|nr:hypothetical protein AAVH_20476 [Aphelenchus avenae]